MLGKTEGRRQGQQRMRRLDNITETTEMDLSKLQEIVKDRQAWSAAVHGVTKQQGFTLSYPRPSRLTGIIELLLHKFEKLSCKQKA